MNWLPVFRIGLWNAWLLMLVVILQPLLLLAVDKAVGTGGIFKKMGEAPADRGESRKNFIATLILYLLEALSIFLPLKLGTGWFYGGLITWLAGLGMLLVALVNAATAPPGQVFQKGMYRYSRHPLYLAMTLILLGTGLASAAWIFLLLAAVFIFLQNSHAYVEERDCLKTFGEEYRQYMQTTPRWLGWPKK